jgi:hypothetical protein
MACAYRTAGGVEGDCWTQSGEGNVDGLAWASVALAVELVPSGPTAWNEDGVAFAG